MHEYEYEYGYEYGYELFIDWSGLAGWRASDSAVSRVFRLRDGGVESAVLYCTVLLCTVVYWWMNASFVAVVVYTLLELRCGSSCD